MPARQPSIREMSTTYQPPKSASSTRRKAHHSSVVNSPGKRTVLSKHQTLNPQVQNPYSGVKPRWQ